MGAKALARIQAASGRFEDFLNGQQPVVVVGAASAMPAFDTWTNDFLRTTLAGMRPTVRFGDGLLGRIPIEQFLDYLEAPQKFSSSRGQIYLTDFFVKPSFGIEARRTLGKGAEFPLPRSRTYAEWISIYAGPAGTSTAPHQDIFSTHTWLAELRGVKRWRLAPPDVALSANLLPQAFTQEAVIEPGDLIYLPPDWWHEVENLGTTLAISGNFCTFDHAERALAEAKQSSSEQRDVWIKTWDEILKGRPRSSDDYQVTLSGL